MFETIKNNKILTISLAIITIVTIGVFFYYGNNDLAVKVQAVASVFMVIGLVLAWLQLRQSKKQLQSDHDWNRRQLALTELIKHRKDLSDSIRELNTSINYREQKDSYSLKEIHKHLCNDENFESTKLNLTDFGKEIKHHIFTILNYYEYLSIGIKNGVFDEIIIKDSAKGGLLKANRLFGEYVKHLRTERHTNNKKLFIEQENVANKWINEDSQKLQERNKTA